MKKCFKNLQTAYFNLYNKSKVNTQNFNNRVRRFLKTISIAVSVQRTLTIPISIQRTLTIDITVSVQPVQRNVTINITLSLK